MFVEDRSADFLKMLYATCLDREPDAPGFDYFMSLLHSGRASWENIAAGVLQSPEYLRTRHGINRSRRAPRFCFLHVERTSGTSFHDYLTEHYRPDEIFPERLWRLHEYPPESFAKYRLFSGHYLLPTCRRYIPADAVYCTMLRRPEDRVISAYQFWRATRPETVADRDAGAVLLARELALADFLRRPDLKGCCDDVYTRRLVPHERPDLTGEDVRQAEEELATFRFVGIREFFALSMLLFAATFQLPLPSRYYRRLDAAELATLPSHDPVEPVAVSPETEQELKRVTRHDRPVYRFALDLFHRRFQAQFGLEIPKPAQ